jgi:hypothetical protein
MSQSPAKRPSVGSILFEVALIAWCSYRLWQGDLGPFWKTIFVVIVGFSTFALFTKLSAMGLFGLSEQSAAEGIHEMQKGMYAGAHEYRHVDDSALKGLDVSFYERATAALEELGFRRMGQIVDVTAERVTPWARAVLRCHLDTTNTIMAAAYDVKMRKWYRGLQLMRVLPGDFRTIDLETELSDGRFVATSNAPEAAKATDYPGIHRRFFSRDVPIAELVEHHRQHVRECLATDDGISAEPVVQESFEAYRASQDRMQILKSKHRASAAYDPAAEIQRVMGRPLNEQEWNVANQVREMRQSERQDG